MRLIFGKLNIQREISSENTTNAIIFRKIWFTTSCSNAMAFEYTIENHTKGNMYRAHQKQEEKITIWLFKLSTLSEHENGKRIVAVFLWTNHFLSSPLLILRYHVNTTFDTATAALDDDVGCCFRHFFV